MYVNRGKEMLQNLSSKLILISTDNYEYITFHSGSILSFIYG